MKKIYFKNLNEYLEQEITIEGFVDNIRILQYVDFLIIRDTTGKVQVTIEKNTSNESLTKIVSTITPESTVKITGILHKNDKVKLNNMELIPTNITVTSKCLEELPLNYKDSKSAAIDTRLNYRFLDLRSEKNILMFKVQTCMINAMREFVIKNNFTEIHTPKIISTASESGSEVFEVNYFGRKAYLAQSPQFYKQMAMCAGFEKVFEIAPAFRAENSNTVKHAAEFWMVEPEICFADLNDYMDLAEEMIKYIFQYVLDNCPEEMEFFNNFIDKGLLERLNHVINSDFVRISYTDAVAELEKHNDEFEYKVSWGIDLQTEHERYLCEQIFKKPVFVTDYPMDIKAFYMKQNPDGKTVAAADLLVPGIGEIIGGSQREENYDKLLNRMKELNMPVENYEWYLDLRKYGSCVHSGFGLGFERAIMYLTGMQNIRDVIPFPRTPKNCEF